MTVIAILSKTQLIQISTIYFSFPLLLTKKKIYLIINEFLYRNSGEEVVSPPHESSKITIFKNLKIILSINTSFW